MFDPVALRACYADLGGVRQHYNGALSPFSLLLTQSTSGRYLQSEHALLTAENIDQCAQNYDRFPHPGYVPTTIYGENETIRLPNGTAYYSLQSGNQGNEPSASPTFWQQLDPLNDFLQGVFLDSAVQLVDYITTLRKINLNGPELWDDVYLFDGVGSLQNRETKAGRFVGYRIDTTGLKDITVVLERIGLQFTSAQPALMLYVYHSSQLAPVATVTVNTGTANLFSWPTEWQSMDLPYYGSNKDAGGAWYIGYYEDHITGQAIHRGLDLSSTGTCQHCDRSYQYMEQWSNIISVHPFSVSAANLQGILPASSSDATGAQMWNTENEVYSYLKTWGINLQLSARCDLTDFYCRQKAVLSDAFMKIAAVRVLEVLQFSTRDNLISERVPAMADLALNGTQTSKGMYKKKELALKAVAFDTGGLNDLCLPCNEQQVFTRRTR